MLVNEEDPIKASLVDDRINSLLSAANLKISQQVSDVSTQYLQILLDGGDFSFLGNGVSILGLKNSEQILRQVKAQLPADSPDGDELDRVIEFSHVAAENLGVAGDLLTSVTQPIKVDKEVVNGDTPSLDTFAIAVAATITLMFVTVLLVAGSLALEREENAFARLTRGLVSQVRPARREGSARGGRRTRRDAADAGRARPLRRPRLGAVPALDPGDHRRRRRRSRPSAPRSGQRRRRSGRPPCSPS